ERNTWNSFNAVGAFSSILKLPLAGGRNSLDGTLTQVGQLGAYWSSSINGVESVYFQVNEAAQLWALQRAFGCSVRCIKN
ncbi:MAG: hypothetical protein RLZ13_563, partial [Bacteroidota bacterium]